MIGLNQLGILSKNFLQLNHSHIIISFPAALQGNIVFLDGLVDRIQLGRLRLHPLDIFRSDIVFRLDIFADNPLAQGGNRLACLKINQAQKISCRYIQLVVLQASLQHIYGARQIADLGLVQPLIVINDR